MTKALFIGAFAALLVVKLTGSTDISWLAVSSPLLVSMSCHLALDWKNVKSRLSTEWEKLKDSN